MKEADFGPATPYRYCPVDATPLEKSGGSSTGMKCPACGRSWYRNSSPSTVAEFRWVTADELDDLDFAWPHDRELVDIALELE